MQKNAVEESIPHSTQLVPYSYYSNCIPGGNQGAIVHWHKEFEINYILKGSSQVLCGEHQFRAEAGDVVVICPNALHGVFPDGMEDYEYDTLVFSPRLLGATVNDRCAQAYIHPLMNGSAVITPLIDRSAAGYEEIRTAVTSIFSCAKRSNSRDDMLLKSEMYRLFWLLDQRGLLQTAPPVHKVHDLRPVLEHINSNFREQLSITQLASLVNLSDSYFMNLFKRLTGVSCIEYITKVRVNAAGEMLLQKKLPVTEVAFACGFSNLSNFNRQFKRITGLCPREYRKAERPATESNVELYV